MKIRLIGAPDIVRAWGQRFEEVFGIRGSEYPSRYGAKEIRMYFDLDDRRAEEIVKTAEAEKPGGGTPNRRKPSGKRAVVARIGPGRRITN